MKKLYVLLLVGGLIFPGCGGDTGASMTPAVPKPGALKAIIVTPNTNDGAVLFTISGGAIDSITASGLTLLPDAKTGSGVLVVGQITNGATLANVWVPDLDKASAYSATIAQAAARGTYNLQNTSAYRISLLQ